MGSWQKTLVNTQLRVRGLHQSGVVVRSAGGQRCGWSTGSCLNPKKGTMLKCNLSWMTLLSQLNWRLTCNPTSGPWTPASLLNSQRKSSFHLLLTNICARLSVMRCLKDWRDIWSMNYSLGGRQGDITQHGPSVDAQGRVPIYLVCKGVILWWSQVPWCGRVSAETLPAHAEEVWVPTCEICCGRHGQGGCCESSELCQVAIGDFPTWWNNESGKWWTWQGLGSKWWVSFMEKGARSGSSWKQHDLWDSWISERR